MSAGDGTENAVNCPNCGKKIPDGTIECPRCARSGSVTYDPTPIAPGAASGSPVLGFLLGLIVAALGAGGWLWVSATFSTIQAWPAVVIGVAVGLIVRVTGGREPQVKQLIGTICGAAGIAGGAALVISHWEMKPDDIAKAAGQYSTLAELLIGLSLARSLSAPKSRQQKAAIGSQ